MLPSVLTIIVIMGVQRKGKYKGRRRKFGVASGRYSSAVKKADKEAFVKRERKIQLYRSDKMYYQPYQLIRKRCRVKGVLLIYLHVPYSPPPQKKKNGKKSPYYKILKHDMLGLY